MKLAAALPLFALAAAFAATGPLGAQTTVAPPALTAAAASFDKAFRGGDTAAVASYLADDLVATSAGGTVQTKKQFLDNYGPMAQQLSSKQVDFDTFQRSNVIVRAYGNVVVMAGALDLHTHISGVPATDMQPVHYRFTQVWALQPTGWKLVATQNGIISKSSGALQPQP